MNKIIFASNSSKLNGVKEELLKKMEKEIDEDGGMSENAFLHKITNFASEIHRDLQDLKPKIEKVNF